MNTTELQTQLIAWSVDNAGHDEHRNYIGLSGIGDCERVIYDRYMDGDHPEEGDLLKFEVAYELEAALIARLSGLGVYRPGREIRIYDGLMQGHTDGETQDGDLIEIKTIASEEYLPAPGRLPRRVFWQVQAYLHYTGQRRAHVVYLARDTGAISVYGVSKNHHVGAEIADKVERLVRAVTLEHRPACTCGRCGR